MWRDAWAKLVRSAGAPVVVVGVRYAEGWDLATRELLGPLSVEAARARDAAGLPYVVEFRMPGRAEPIEVRLVSWQDLFAGVWVYDEQGRRTRLLELRQLDDDRLLRRCTKSWTYAGPEVPEFDRRCAWTEVRLYPGREGWTTRAPRGSAGVVSTGMADVPEEQRWLPRPGFDEWPLFSADDFRLRGELSFEVVEGFEGGTVASGREVWLAKPPVGLGHLDALFRPGTRVSTSGPHGELVVLEAETGPVVRVPSGRLAVDSPDNEGEPTVTVEVPPGEYPVEIARLGYDHGDGWEGHVGHADSPAVRLRVSDELPVSWRRAESAGDDVTLLFDGQACGFFTEISTGCFADAQAWPSLRALFDEASATRAPEVEEDLWYGSGSTTKVTDEAMGADLVAFATDGDGGYPVWLGLDESGKVACVAVKVDDLPDLQVL